MEKLMKKYFTQNFCFSMQPRCLTRRMPTGITVKTYQILTFLDAKLPKADYFYRKINFWDQIEKWNIILKINAVMGNI